MKTLLNLKGDLLIFLTMLIFGSYALFLRLLPEISPLIFLFFFQLIGLLAFSFLVIKQGFPRLSGRMFLLLLSLAIVALANDLAYFFAFRLTTVANAAAAHQMVSFFLLFLAPWLIAEKTKRHEWLALIFAIAGIAVLYKGGLAIGQSTHFLGISLGLASAFFLAFLIILYRYLPQQGLTISFINFWRYLLSVVILLPVMLSFNWFNFAPTGKNLGLVVLFGLLFAFIASGVHNFGLSRARPLHASIIGKSEPVIAAFYAMLFLKEIPTLQVILGGALIIGSSAWLVFRKEKN